MKINFKPLPTKARAEREHLRDAHPSLMGPTNDNTGQGLLPFAQANKPSTKEYS